MAEKLKSSTHWAFRQHYSVSNLAYAKHLRHPQFSKLLRVSFLFYFFVFLHQFGKFYTWLTGVFFLLMMRGHYKIY